MKPGTNFGKQSSGQACRRTIGVAWRRWKGSIETVDYPRVSAFCSSNSRGQYLVTQGFQLLAEDQLTGEEWMKYRRYADQRTSEIVDRALALHAKRNVQGR
jgi:hypothetical protein